MLHKDLTNSSYRFTSSLSKPLEMYIAEKKGLGYKSITILRYAKNIDKCANEFNCIKDVVTRDFAEHYAILRPTEKSMSRYKRILSINDFSSFLQRLGKVSYTLPVPPKPKRSCVPYIFSKDEFMRLYNSAGKLYANYRHYSITMQLILMLLYCCGLRKAEVCSLRIQDVDFNNFVLIILNTKFNKNRFVPITEQLCVQLKNYISIVHTYPTPDTLLLKNGLGNELNKWSINTMFLKVLQLANIPHIGNGYGPRVHDLRHTFAVNCLKQLVSDGVDLKSGLVYLTKYLGHSTLESSQYYLRLTADVYPNIVEMLNKQFGEIVPNVEAKNE